MNSGSKNFNKTLKSPNTAKNTSSTWYRKMQRISCTPQCDKTFLSGTSTQNPLKSAIPISLSKHWRNCRNPGKKASGTNPLKDLSKTTCQTCKPHQWTISQASVKSWLRKMTSSLLSTFSSRLMSIRRDYCQRKSFCST